MSGIKVFKSDCYLDIFGSSPSLGSVDISQWTFKTVWDFFKQLETQGYVTEIARNNGSSATFSPKGLGTDFYNEANPFGENAWAVFLFPPSSNRIVPYYVFFQWNLGTDFGSAPGSPGLILGGSGGSVSNINLGFAMAAATDDLGDYTSPWPMASTGSMGSDTKQSPVWEIPVDGFSYIFPRSNSVGGTYATIRQNTCGFQLAAPSTDLRIDCVGDEDNWAITINDNSTFQDNSFVGGGYYISHPDITTAAVPLFMLCTRSSISFIDRSSSWGTTLGNNIREGGASILKTGPDTVLPVQFGWDAAVEKNNQNFTNFLDPKNCLYPINVGINTYDVGYLDNSFWRVIYGAYPRDTVIDASWIVVSGSSLTANPERVSLIIPWNGVKSKGGNFTPSGFMLP